MSVLHAIILAIVEGLTEFLPVSSTGHLIIAASWMGVASEPFSKTFIVAIQLGAILSVVVLYGNRFFQSVDFYAKLFVAFLPAAVLGVLFRHSIDALLGRVDVVGYMLILGGIVLLFIDNFFKASEAGPEKPVTFPIAIKIGLFQSLAVLAPGVSRSAATIIGGLTQGLTRKGAAEFSFFSRRSDPVCCYGVQTPQLLQNNGTFYGKRNKAAPDRQCRSFSGGPDRYPILHFLLNHPWFQDLQDQPRMGPEGDDYGFTARFPGDLFQAKEKEYTGKFVIGQTTPSHDLETTPTAPVDITGVSHDDLKAAAQTFTGKITQTPPLHSAIKIDGKRAYEFARKGLAAELKSREVFVREFEITSFAKPFVGFRIVCSKGTYVRSLARDFGETLGVGAFLAELCRTRIGEFELKDALRIEDIV